MAYKQQQLSTEDLQALDSCNNYWKEILQRDGDIRTAAMQELRMAMQILGGPAALLKIVSDHATELVKK